MSEYLNAAEHIILESEADEKRRDLLTRLWSANSRWEVLELSRELSELQSAKDKQEFMKLSADEALETEEGRRRRDEALAAFAQAEQKQDSVLTENS